MTDIERMKNDFDYFCEVVFGRKLPEWQSNAVQQMILTGTVVTKTTLTEDVSGASIDFCIVDDVYEPPKGDE
jgi:hypothetical protein